MRKLLKQTLALATAVAMCLSVASPALTAYADDTTAPTADSYVDAGDTADVSPFGSIATPETADAEAAEPEPEVQPAEPATPETAAEPLAVLDPESTVTTANVGDTVTLTTTLNREDVEVTYQWQVLRRASTETEVEPVHPYAEGEPTWYVFPF